MGYLNNVKKLYIISFFHSLIPAYVIERLFWQQRGMNVQMVVYCEIIYAATVTILEVPSGILADKFGRKRLLIISGVLSAAEFIVLLSAYNFWTFGADMILAGIGKSFSSGSENALLYDSLLAENRQADYEKFIGRQAAADFMGGLLAALCGSLLANFMGLEINYWFSFFSMAAAFFITLTLKEPQMITSPENETVGILKYTKQAVSVFKRQPIVFWYCLSGAVLGACLTYVDEFWQLILEASKIPVLFFGVFGSILSFVRIPGNLFAYKLKKHFRLKNILYVIFLFNIAGYFTLIFTGNAWSLIPVIAIVAAMGLSEPLISGYLHSHTKSRIRATVESVSSLGLRLISVLIGLTFGYLSTNFSLGAGFGLLGCVCLIYFLILNLKNFI